MAEEASRVQIGAALRRDATGVWHKATRSGRILTLRILREDLAERDDARHLFAEEMRRIERLDHPALLQVHEASRSAPRPWLLTDAIDGGSLAEALADGAAWAPEAALDLVRCLHGGFRYLQERKQVHAAPWPANIVRVDDGWKLTTFRSIRAWDELGTLKGKKDAHAPWTPPERTREHPAPLKPEGWISWSLGVVLRALLGAQAVAPWPAVIARLAADDPALRPQGRRAVDEALAGRLTSGAPPSGPAPLRAPVPRRRRRGRS